MILIMWLSKKLVMLLLKIKYLYPLNFTQIKIMNYTFENGESISKFQKKHATQHT